MKRKQEWIVSVLTARKIPFEEIDISDPTREAEKQFMRENSPLKEGQTVPMAPQIFNADEYCGVGLAFYRFLSCFLSSSFLSCVFPVLFHSNVDDANHMVYFILVLLFWHCP